jgi:uncharacterized Fe-S cluster-containing MiaB family protein
MPEYRAPRLWSIVEVTERAAYEGLLDHLTLQIGLSTEELPTTPDGAPKNCGRCDAVVIKALEAFNASQKFKAPTCACREDMKK